jgi:hypothetical protein
MLETRVEAKLPSPFVTIATFCSNLFFHSVFALFCEQVAEKLSESGRIGYPKAGLGGSEADLECQ